MISRSLRLAACSALALIAAAPALGEVCATPGRDGIGIGVSGVVNTYWGGDASVSAGANAIVLGSADGALDAIAAGDLLLIIQMQDAEFNSSDSSSYGDGVAGGDASGYTALNQTGAYEFVRATNAVATTGGTVQIIGATGAGLVNSYAHADATLTRGRRSFQVIRVPQYSNASLGAGLTARAWNGRVGGVLAIDVAANLDLAGGFADVRGRGFRGGGGRRLLGLGLPLGFQYTLGSLLSANGSKGEGISGTPKYLAEVGGLIQNLLDLLVDGLPGGSHARGAPGNAGGGATDGSPLTNSGNSGGGGGAGYGGGGRGGHAYCFFGGPNSCSQVGGFGGAGVSAMSAAKLILGGGGGAGSNNSGSGLLGNGFGSSGASGGGLVFIRAGAVLGTGSILADGSDASSSVDDDGSGGGGGGGGVMLDARELAAGALVSLSARGGRGGSNTGGGSAHGPGGGGGGGFIQSTVAAVADVGAGSNGVTVNGGVFGTAYGATSGLSGLAQVGLGASINVSGVLSGSDCSPQLDKSFGAAQVSLGGKTRLNFILKNRYLSAPVSALAFIDLYPAGMVNAAIPNVTTSCGGAIIAAAGTDSLQVTGASIAAGGTCQIGVDVLGGGIGDLVNTIASGGLTGTIVDVLVGTIFSATATLNVIQPLDATKTSEVISDPFNLTTNPKAVPGSLVEYRIEVSNPTAIAAEDVVVADAVPANARLMVADPGGADPVVFEDGSPASGLSYSYISLGSAGDSVSFSNDDGASWTYTPIDVGDGSDPDVTNLRVSLGGEQDAGRGFALRFRVILD